MSTTSAAELSISCAASGRVMENCRTLIKEWSAKTGHRVRLYIHPESSTSQLGLYRKKFKERSSEVDVLMLDVVWPSILEEHLLDLTPFAKDVHAQHTPEMIANNTVNGKLLAMPWFADIAFLFYRKDLLAKYREPVPATWAGLASTARRIQDAERRAGHTAIQGYLFPASQYEGLTCNALEWIASHGGGTVIDAAGNITVKNANAARALDMAAGWINTISSSEVLTYTDENTRKEFEAGNAVFMRNWTYAWHLSQLPDSVVREKVGVAALPRAPGGRSTTTLGGWNLAVSKYSKNPQLAAELVMFLTSRAVQKRRAIMIGSLPTYPALYRDPEVQAAFPFLKNLGNVLKHTVARPSTITGEKYDLVSSAIWKAATITLEQRVEGAQAVRQLERELGHIRQGPSW